MRIKIQITGAVQGVGFRPFVYRLARELGLKGYVLNDMAGLRIEAEGGKQQLDSFLGRLESEKPAISRIYGLQYSFLEDRGLKDFQIRKSDEAGDITAALLPDIALCDECAKEITDPKDRRFMYLFANCTDCGPRFSIIEDLPYDRKNTSMKSFNMCAECAQEYGLEEDRRFHAQPNGCHICGPWVSLYDNKGNLLCTKDDALEKTVNHIRNGSIVAVKGLGGYHLVCDAADEQAVAALRTRKHRAEKPFAVMFPNIEMIKDAAHINDDEARALMSVERPVVIVRKKENCSLADAVSPDNNTIGCFLPYTPLHMIMLRKLRRPVVATSANISDEPIIKDEEDALKRLGDIVDFIFINNRAIVRRCDDSVVKVAAGRQISLRRSRGFAPLPVILPFKLNRTVLALGSYMNNTVALGIDDRVYLSQHIGDLDTPLATEFYEETIDDLLRLFDVDPEVVVADMHPGYYSTKFGEKRYSDRLVKVQHHFSHILSCMAENDVPADSQVIGFAFDGTGYGTDNTTWGGEVMVASYKGFKRAFHLRPFRLPGGDKAVMEPCRTALSLLYETFGDRALEYSHMPEKEKLFIMDMLKKDVHSPMTTSMGRLFDGVASIIGLKHKVSYHAQAAIALEQLAQGCDEKGSYPFIIKNNIIYHVHIIEHIINELNAGIPREVIAAKFHNTITEIILSVSELLRDETGIKRVALSGGVFQNSILLESSFVRLKEKGFVPLVHQLVPSNDGGIALGQAVSVK